MPCGDGLCMCRLLGWQPMSLCIAPQRVLTKRPSDCQLGVWKDTSSQRGAYSFSLPTYPNTYLFGYGLLKNGQFNGTVMCEPTLVSPYCGSEGTGACWGDGSSVYDCIITTTYHYATLYGGSTYGLATVQGLSVINVTKRW